MCTLKLSRRLLPGLQGHTLKDLADYFHVSYSRLHRALDDALVTAQVFLELLNFLWNNYGIDDYFSIKRLTKIGRF